MGSTATTRPGFSSGPRPGGPKFWMNGSSCIARPIPWPPYSRTRANPAPSATCWIAAPMSERRPPGRIASIAASSASSVTRTSLSASGVDGSSPTITVTAESPWKPSQMAPQSSERTSPVLSTRSRDGMPWTISSLIEAQIVAGYEPW